MTEIFQNLFVGSQDDYEQFVKFQSDWYVVQACKEPYHRQALGYTGRAVSSTHPEYLIAKRDNRLILNLVDVDNPDYISKQIIDRALEFIATNLKNCKILIHCNQGMSRSAVIGLLYLHKTGIISTDNFHEAEQQYRKIYPEYNPANGMKMFASINWDYYKK